MTKLILIILILASNALLACERPYKIQVGPYFNSASVVAFWTEFAQEIALKTQCPTNLYPAPTYESHLLATLANDGDIFVVPGYYVHTLQKYGLVGIIKTVTPTKTYLVTKKTLNPNNLRSLIGKRVSIPSPYTESYLTIKIKMAANAIPENAINFEFGNSVQSNAMNVFKGIIDGAAVFSIAFDPLPESIKKNINYNTLIEDNSGGYLLIREDADQKLIQAIKESHSKIKLLKWVTTKLPEQPSIYSSIFQTQVNQLLSKQNPTPH